MKEQDLKIEDWEKEFLSAHEQEQKKNRAVEWGKLGGRPKQEILKSERINLRFTPSELQKLDEIAERKKLNTTDYCREMLLKQSSGREVFKRILPELKEEFDRISGMMKSGIFNENEKEDLIMEIRNLLYNVKSETQRFQRNEKDNLMPENENISSKTGVKTKVKTLRFTAVEMRKILEDAEKVKLKPTQYCRIILLGISISDIKKNKTLFMYYLKLGKICNYMKMGIFTKIEMNQMVSDIEGVRTIVDENIKWS